MRGHGIAAAGTSIEQSSMNALSLEILCRTMYKAHLIGGAPRIPEEELQRPSSEGRRLRGSAGGEEGMRASGRYYVSRAEEMLGRRIDQDDD